MDNAYEQNGIKVSVSIGSSKSQSNSSASTNTSAGSTVKAGGNVTIHATEQDLTVQGSNVQAGDTVALKAAKDVNILASADTESNRSTNSSKDHVQNSTWKSVFSEYVYADETCASISVNFGRSRRYLHHIAALWLFANALMPGPFAKAPSWPSRYWTRQTRS